MVRPLLIVSGVLALAAGAAASNSSEAAYSTPDLAVIVDPRPTAAKWSSFKERGPYLFPVPAHAPAFTLEEYIGKSPSTADRALADKRRKAGFQIGRHRVWEGRNIQARRTADAFVFAFLFRTAAGANTGFRLFRPSRQAGGKTLASNSLGEESVGWYSKAGGERAGYFWRRQNLVIMSFMQCHGTCGFPVIPPARTYAYQLDGRAKRRS
jgi:hypothetical protein